MIKFILKLSLFLIFAFLGLKSNAQQAILTAGGNGVGSGGAMSYSIGQIDYTAFQNTNNFIELGVQHPGDIPPPVASSPQKFCTNAVTLASITITGTNIKWYTASTGGILLPASTTLVNNTTYYATQTIGVLESNLRTPVLVNVSNINFTFASKTDNNCLVGNMGAASVNNATGGIAPYTYNWTPGNPTGDGTTTITGLSAGTYTCTVTDAIGCTKDVVVEILQGNTTITLVGSYQNNVTCYNGSNGSVGVNPASGGVAPYTYSWLHDPLNTTLAASDLPAGAYTCTATDANGCRGTYQFILVNPSPISAPTASSPQTFCGATTLNSIVVTGQNIKWYNATTGGTLLAGTTSIVSGTTYYASQTVNGCESPTRVAVVANIGTTPIINTQPSNVTITEGQTTAFSISASNVVSRQWQYSTDSGNTWNNLVDSGGLPTVLGATNGAVFLGNVPVSWNGYLFRILLSNDSCTNIPSNAVTLTVNSICSSITTWDGTAWSNGIPNSSTQANFTGNYSSVSDLQTCKVTVSNNANVVINPTHTLSAEYEINVVSGSSLTVENNAAIKQTNNVTNTGNVIVKRESAPMIRLDYTAWSSPVQNQQLLAFSPYTQTNRFYTYNPIGINTASSYLATNPINNFDVAKGYLIRVANYWSSTVYSSYNGIFTGILNNGIYNLPIGTGFNLIGNPYASPINANTFLTNNTSISTLYFWTHTVPATGVGFPTNNYASYTNLGGTASAAGGEIPNGFIQTGQGFYVKTNTGNNALFTNAMRVPALFSTQFFKNSEVEKHRFWLNLNGQNNAHNQILIGYMEGASNNVDNAIDGYLFTDENTVLYSFVGNEKFAIQGKGLPFESSDIVPLGIKINSSGTFTINIENKDGLFINQNIYLRDKYQNVIHNLNTAYSFNSEQGTFNDRFEIVYQNSVLGNETFETNDFQIYTSNNNIIMKSDDENIFSVELFDVLGKRIFFKHHINSNEFSLTSNFESKIIIVKVTFDSQKTINKKLILNN